MELMLSEEQEMLRKVVRDFLADKCPKTLVRQMEEDAKGYSAQVWQEMAELGWMGLAFPEQYGGSGRSFLDLMILLEETGRALVPGPFFSTVILAGLPILDAGTEEQKQEFVHKIIDGKAIFTLALIESSATYDAASITVKASASGDDYVIDGVKLFVPDAHVADYLLCVARTSEQVEPELGITIFIVDAKSPGISQTAYKVLAGNKVSEVVFNKVRVGKQNILGELDRGWDEVQKILRWAAVAKCCEMVGITQQILEMTVDYAKTRIRFGRPIGSFQAIQHECARMLIDIDGLRLSAYQAACAVSEGLPCNKEIAIAKAWMDDASERVITRAHQMHGAIGITMDYDLQLFTRRAKSAQAVFGNSDFYREMVAQEMCL